VVEGFFDCLRIHQAGFGNVAALMGVSLSEVQEKLLLDRFQQLVLMLDGDKVGQRASQQLAARLRGQVSLSMVRVPVGNQTNCRVRKSANFWAGRGEPRSPEHEMRLQLRFG
jgi:DNA primase